MYVQKRVSPHKMCAQSLKAVSLLQIGSLGGGNQARTESPKEIQGSNEEMESMEKGDGSWMPREERKRTLTVLEKGRRSRFRFECIMSNGPRRKKKSLSRARIQEGICGKRG